MTTSPLKDRDRSKGERSPTDPQECCDWANTRLRASGDFSREWKTTSDPKRPIILVRVPV